LGRRRRGTLVALCVAILAVFTAYGRADESPLALGVEDVAGPADAGGGQLGPARNEVSILGAWSGAQLEAFWEVAQPFAQDRGLTLNFESTPDVAGVLAARIEAGTPPDIAILQGVGLVERYARQGRLVPLGRTLDTAKLGRRYPAGWLDLVTVRGQIYGAFCLAANKSIVWYSPAEFQKRKWAIPVTWAELVSLGNRIAAMGLTPWSLALDGEWASGEQGTDWVENLILRAEGAETYDRWVRHEIPWTAGPVRRAFLRWAEIVARSRNLCGGARGALETDWADGVDALYADIPAAYLYLGGSFVQPMIGRHFSERTVGKDYDFFPLPSLDLHDETAAVAGADVAVMLNDTPQAAAILGHLASREAEALWVRAGGCVAPGRDLDLDQYPDPLSRRAARQLREADVLRFDASQQMPPEVAEAFRKGVRDFVANPSRLDEILKETESVAREAYLGLGPE
jgi:alpha-glucoside transport system substrate-binding protein